MFSLGLCGWGWYGGGPEWFSGWCFFSRLSWDASRFLYVRTCGHKWGVVGCGPFLAAVQLLFSPGILATSCAHCCFPSITAAHDDTDGVIESITTDFVAFLAHLTSLLLSIAVVSDSMYTSRCSHHENQGWLWTWSVRTVASGSLLWKDAVLIGVADKRLRQNTHRPEVQHGHACDPNRVITEHDRVFMVS